MCLFSIIIVNWNTRDLLAQCLESVISSQLSVISNQSELITDHRSAITVHCSLTTEVFVVDNASADGSAQMVRERFPQVRLIENTENVGFARANNQAIRESTGRYVLLLNSDTVVRPNALLQMLRFMDAHPQVGLLGANLLNPDWSPQICYGQSPTPYQEALIALGLNQRGILASALQQFRARSNEPGDDFLPTGWVLGASMLTRREVIAAVGLLDEGYFMFNEEVDWADRIVAAGWQVGYLRSAAIVHYGQASSKQRPNRMIPQLYQSKLRYFRRRGHTASLLPFRGAILLSAGMKALWNGLFSLWKPPCRQEARLWWEVVQVAVRPVPHE
jgi:GT2 family glycosyltransferase